MDSQCLMCHLRRNLELVKPLGTEEQTMAFARDMMRMYLAAPEDVSSPWFNPQVADLLEKHYGIPQDSYREDKEMSNRFVLERMDMLRQTAKNAEDPVLAGLQLSILGNYLDFSALRGQVSFEKLDEMITEALEMKLDQAVYHRFCRELAEGKRRANIEVVSITGNEITKLNSESSLYSVSQRKNRIIGISSDKLYSYNISGKLEGTMPVKHHLKKVVLLPNSNMYTLRGATIDKIKINLNKK